jgi:hypothetical protein
MYVNCSVVRVGSLVSQSNKTTYVSGAVKQGAEGRIQEVTGEKHITMGAADFLPVSFYGQDH